MVDRNTLQDLTYTYDAVGNITRIVDASETNSAKVMDYAYDDLYRLTRASSSNAINNQDYLETYSYSAIGNITNKSDQGNYLYADNGYNNPQAVTNVAGSSYTYDNNGNLTSDGVWAHGWDYRNRLIQSTDGTSTIHYAYDSQDMRVKYSVNGMATTTTVNQFYSVSGTGTSTINIYANNQLIATIEGSSIYYAHNDHLGGSSVMSDSDGNISELIDYLPFGGIRLDEKAGSFDEKHKYTGHEYDAETGLNYMRARYQSGRDGRFISVDPVFNLIGSADCVEKITHRPLSFILAAPQLLNSYGYVKDNPLRFFDPFGLWVNNGDGSFTAEKGDTLSGLQKETGRNWHDTGFKRDPKTLQIGENVSFNKPKIYAGVTIDSSKEATTQYFVGTGGSVNLGPNAQAALRNSDEQKFRQGRITSGSTLPNGDYGVDLTNEQFYIGRTVVEYTTTRGTKYCVTTFTGFVRDGFWDIYKKNGDGIGPKYEIPGGTPYAFNPYSWTTSYPVLN